MTDEDFFDGEMMNTSSDDMTNTSSDDCEEHPRPLQLPRVGWGDDDDAVAPAAPEALSPGSPNDEVPRPLVRRLSRTSGVDSDLASIPEDLSMHGTWPDYYPDSFASNASWLECCDYDHDRKQYVGFGPVFKRRVFVLFLIVFASLVGIRAKMAGKRSQPSLTAEDPVTTGDVKTLYPPADPSVDLYEAIVDTLQPIMSDGRQFTFFHAFEFCGSVYNRIPCPYIAYCPLGPGHAPLGGTRISTTGTWAPIYNRDGRRPDWVQLGTEGTCEMYSKRHDDPPPWENLEGEDADGVSRHVMCCLETVDGAAVGGEEDGGPSNDPDYLDRPPSLEWDEAGTSLPQRSTSGGD